MFYTFAYARQARGIRNWIRVAHLIRTFPTPHDCACRAGGHMPPRWCAAQWQWPPNESPSDRHRRVAPSYFNEGPRLRRARRCRGDPQTSAGWEPRAGQRSQSPRPSASRGTRNAGNRCRAGDAASDFRKCRRSESGQDRGSLNKVSKHPSIRHNVYCESWYSLA